ncbi:HNH endonuclease [Effusibacillus consociatus]|uniref:HNH endonuclease n=1 Tax=Effusibacillus consociatus TaxID=1117041 RepID=A0ABV9Q484_9BACL
MKNHFEIHGDITIIFLERKRSNECLIAKIDTDDLDLVKTSSVNWYACFDNHTQSYYVRGYRFENGKIKHFQLHRLLMNPSKGQVVDHINHDTLDNRKANLRILTSAQNRQNLKGAYKSSKSGVQGVMWRKDVGKWQARVKLNGKEKHLGYFDDLQEAKAVVAQAREKYYPFSQEALQN